MLKVAKNSSSRSTPADYLSGDQQDRLLSYVKEKANRARLNGTRRAIVDELIILLMTNAGLRPREVCSLKIEDLPLAQSENVLRIRDAQGKRTRAVDITPDTAGCLQRFVRLYRAGARPKEPLLLSERGNRLIYMSLYSKVKRVGREAGIGKLHPQMLRRTFLIRLYHAERDLRFVQQQAGHASPKTTAIYVKTKGQSRQQRSTADSASHSSITSRQNRARRLTAPARAHQESASSQPTLRTDPQRTETCEACGKGVTERSGTRIDSGQIVCISCLKELRGR